MPAVWPVPFQAGSLRRPDGAAWLVFLAAPPTSSAPMPISMWSPAREARGKPDRIVWLTWVASFAGTTWCPAPLLSPGFPRPRLAAAGRSMHMGTPAEQAVPRTLPRTARHRGGGGGGGGREATPRSIRRGATRKIWASLRFCSRSLLPRPLNTSAGRFSPQRLPEHLAHLLTIGSARAGCQISFHTASTRPDGRAAAGGQRLRRIAPKMPAVMHSWPRGAGLGPPSPPPLTSRFREVDGQLT